MDGRWVALESVLENGRLLRYALTADNRLAAAERGVRVLGADRYDRPLALIELKNGSSGPTQYIAGTENFYAVTRYNWSAFYALSVIELGREVHDAYLAGQSAARSGAPSAKATASAL